MSYVAGRVAIVPKGAFSASTQYDRLDMVVYNGSSYVSKTRPPVGTLPTDTQYWVLSIDISNKVDTEDFDDLEDRVSDVETNLTKITPLPTPTEFDNTKFKVLSECPISVDGANMRVTVGNPITEEIFAVDVSRNEVARSDKYAREWHLYQLPVETGDTIKLIDCLNGEVFILTTNGKMYVYLPETDTWGTFRFRADSIAPNIKSVCFDSTTNYFFISSMGTNSASFSYTAYSTTYSLQGLSPSNSYGAIEVLFDDIICTLAIGGKFFRFKYSQTDGQTIDIYSISGRRLDDEATHSLSDKVKWVQAFPYSSGIVFLCLYGSNISKFTYNATLHTFIEEVIGMALTSDVPSQFVFADSGAYFVLNSHLFNYNGETISEYTLPTMQNALAQIAYSDAYNNEIVLFDSAEQVMALVKSCDYVLRAYDDGTYEWVKVGGEDE